MPSNALNKDLIPTSPVALLLPIAYMAVIFWTSSVSDTNPGNWSDDMYAGIGQELQNLLHFPIYSVLAVLWCRAGWRWFPNIAGVVIFAWLTASGYGALDEWHQSFVPGRFSSLNDVVTNMMGAAAGVLAYGLWFRHLHNAASAVNDSRSGLES
jgi:hypothetical protein